MKKALPFLAALAALAALACPAAQAARLTEPVGKEMLRYAVTADQSGTNISAKAVVGPLYMAEDGYSLRRGVTPVAAGTLAGVVPVLPYPNGLTQAQVQTKATAFFKEYYPTIRDSLRGWMHNNGVSHAWVSYKQTVNVASSTGTDAMAIQWSAFIDDGGRGIAPDPKVVMDKGLKILQVRYIPLATAAEVPASLSYSDAGNLYYRVVSDTFVPLTDWTVLQTNGAFDQPADPGDGTPIDPDGGLKCLMDKSKNGPAWQPYNAVDDSVTCDQSMPDVISLMDNTNSQLAVVDYVRQVAPVWCREDDAPCLAGTAGPNPDLPPDPNAQYIPLIAYRFDLRTLGGNACSVQEFRNHGWSGYKLDLTTDRYMAFSTGAYQSVNEFHGTWLSNAIEFDHLVTLPSTTTQDAMSMAGKVINPQSPANVVNVTDVPNIVELAPVTSLVNLGGTYDVLAQKNCGFFFSSISATLRCHPGGQIGLSAVSRWWNGSVFATSPEVLFSRGSATSGALVMTSIWQTSWANGWAYDGANTVTFPGLYTFNFDAYGNWIGWTPYCAIPFN